MSNAPELYLRLYWYVLFVCASYNGVHIHMLVHVITVSVLLCLCILYNLIVAYTSPWYFFPYFSCAWVIPPLRHCYICDGINMFVNVTYMVTAICFFTLYDKLLGCATSWESCHAYLLYIGCYDIFIILVDLHSQYWIKISLFKLVVKGTEIPIFLPNISISHLFISIKTFNCYFSLL